MKLFAILNVFRRGAVVADPVLWKKGGIALQSAIAALALSLNPILKGAGLEVEISNEVALAIGLVVAWVVGVFFAVATTDKLGIPGLAPMPSQPAPVDPAQDDLRGGP